MTKTCINRRISVHSAALAIMLFLACAGSAVAQGTAFTYQGVLKDGGNPASGSYDMTFRVFDDGVAGTQYGTDVVLTGVAAAAGLFTVNLDFGPDVFLSAPRWLEIEVNGQSLTPRQEITATPFAQKSIDADYATTAGLAGPWQTDGSNVTYLDGNVGIGTSTPTAKLEVAGASGVDGIKFPDGSLQKTAAIGGGGSIWSLNGTNAYYNAGKVGIGRSDPPDPLSFSNTVGDKISLYGDTGGTYGFGIQGGLLQIHTNNSGADIAFGFGPSTAFTETMRVRGNGNVGIGTLAPGAKLHVAGNMKMDGANTLEFGAGVPKEVSAGKIGYQAFGSFDSLDIVGAGTLGSNRKIRFYNEGGALFQGPIGTLSVVASSSAVYGQSTQGTAVAGVFGRSDANAGNGVIGEAPIGASAYGVWGRATQGIGGYFSGGNLALWADGRARVKVLEIVGGADFSENFDIGTESDESEPTPGMIVSIDPKKPGKLLVCNRAYDRAVAGIISGAGGVDVGMTMAHEGTVASGKYPVALTGRVYALCDASSGTITPGDLLTASGTPGHAMKAADHKRSHGAVIGKAMSSLETGRGLVLVLVNLQ